MRNFPDWLTAYTEHTAITEAPLSFHLWTGVSTIAGALRRKVWIDQRAFQWTPNFYIVLVGPPGVVTKSTTIGLGYRLLEKTREIGGDAAEGIHFGPDSATWQALGESLMEARENLIWTDHAGSEHKQEISCMTCSISELGTLLKVQADGLVDMLTDLWDGKDRPWRHKTKTQSEIQIQRPWINIIGCTTPSWLREHVPEHMIGGGFMSRCVFVYGERKRHIVAYPSQVQLPYDYHQQEKKLVQDLHSIASLSGEYILALDALEWGERWYHDLWNGSRPSHMASARFDGYLARKQTMLHKLAMVLAASQGSSLVIERQHLERANELIALVEPDMLKVFESVGVVREAQHVHEIKTFVEVHGVVTSKELWALCRNVMSLDEFTRGLKAAVEAGVLTPTTKGGTKAVMPPPQGS